MNRKGDAVSHLKFCESKVIRLLLSICKPFTVWYQYFLLEEQVPPTHPLRSNTKPARVTGVKNGKKMTVLVLHVEELIFFVQVHCFGFLMKIPKITH